LILFCPAVSERYEMFSILTEEHYQKKIKLNPSGAYKLSVKAAFLSFFSSNWKESCPSILRYIRSKTDGPTLSRKPRTEEKQKWKKNT